jgi:putative transport protein
LREFGLILFVFTIGLQIGPGFFASLRDQGLPLNELAAAIVVGGGLLTLIFAKIFGIAFGAAAGLFSGATTNTPALGAAQQALAGLKADEALAGIPALSYAIAHPQGIVWIIASIIIVRLVFGIDVEKEAAQFEDQQRSGSEPIAWLNLLVENANLDGLRVDAIPGLRNGGYRLSFEASGRIRSAGGDRRFDGAHRRRSPVPLIPPLTWKAFNAWSDAPATRIS